jgi:hypothetical protein
LGICEYKPSIVSFSVNPQPIHVERGLETNAQEVEKETEAAIEIGKKIKKNQGIEKGLGKDLGRSLKSEIEIEEIEIEKKIGRGEKD